MNKEMPKAYEAVSYESDIYKKWEESGVFNPDNLNLPAGAKSYTIVMPPPNVTGTLHLGHAAMLAIEDLLIRYHRMKGERALWLPGTDHAAIATQTKVEKIIKEEWVNRHEMGREKFLERVREFAQNSHDTIVNQVKKMGSSCDWSREAYTLDETRTRAVRSVFKMMYDDGLIYRGERIVNWCPRCHSTLADDEVEHKEGNAKLYWIKYGPFVLATSRPETKLGDTAVAVHPDDERYKHMVGKKYMIPGVLGEFEIVVVADRSVDPEFGSGAIKVTPAHSFVDNEIAQRHNLPMKKIIDEDGKMMANCGKYAGLATREAREQIVADMEKMGLIDHIDENYKHSAALCYRCDTPVEPLPSLQWFIDVNKKVKRLNNKSIKETCLDAVRSGVFGRDKIRIIPDQFEKVYFNWMENLRDWCISRQIWFGHQVPVWYRESKVESRKSKVNNEEIYVGVDEPEEKTNFVFLHGFYRTREVKDPLNWLNQKLERKDNFWEILPGHDKPNRIEQTKFVLKRAKITEDTVIVTHSLGGVLAMKMIEENDLKIKKLVLLASPMILKKPELVDYNSGNKINFEKIKESVGEIIVFQPGEDKVLLESEIIELAKKLGARLIKVEDSASHFNEDENQAILNELKKDVWIQDPDTLDTWFSSGLWTFSTLANSPEQVKLEDGKLKIDSEDFKNFHPTAVLETGYDIIFFWVARMIIMTTYAVGDIPFQDVYLHGLVLDDKGKKMSKSKGNVIDPLDMIAKYGTDATRLSLVIGSTPGSDMRLNEEKIASFRNFTNKLWNISRYIVTNYELEITNYELDQSKLTDADFWILWKMAILIPSVTSDLEKYQFSQAGEKLREFTWNDLADWYLEVSKFEKTESKAEILNLILRDLLKLWHPFTPFVTEKIWEEIGNGDYLITSPWSNGKSYIETQFNTRWRGFHLIMFIIKEIRNARSENGVEPSRKVKAVLVVVDSDMKKIIKKNEELIKKMRTGIEELEITDKDSAHEGAISIVVGDVKVYLLGAVDKDKEKNRLAKEIENLEKWINSAEKKLENQEFVKNAPKQIVEREQENLKTRKKELESLRERLGQLNG